MKCLANKICKATTEGRKFCLRPPVVALNAQMALMAPQKVPLVLSVHSRTVIMVMRHLSTSHR